MKNKIAITISLAAILLSITALVLVNKEKVLAGSDFAYGYFTGITSATSTIQYTATTTPIYSGSEQANVEICNTIASPAYLYLLADNSTSTMATTTMAVQSGSSGKGVWLDGRGNTTSTENVCRRFSNFKGYIRGIGVTTTPVLVNYSR